jgi:carbon monoxide dehydrogenase subunit G
MPGTRARNKKGSVYLLVNVIENLDLKASQSDVWRLLRDTERLGALIPGVESISRIEEAERESYAGVVTEKVGPFKVTLNMEIEFTEIVESSFLKGSIKGQDKHKLSRATGTVSVTLNSTADNTQMQFEVVVEVLGKLATLGSTVIRRRVNELFGEFARRFELQFEVAA